jgi:hypothetical protein
MAFSEYDNPHSGLVVHGEPPVLIWINIGGRDCLSLLVNKKGLLDQ